MQLQPNAAIVDVFRDDVMFHPVAAILNGDQSQWLPLTANNISRIYGDYEIAVRVMCRRLCSFPLLLLLLWRL